jgi:hypothetical protein
MARGTRHIDPERPFPVGTRDGRNTHISGPSVEKQTRAGIWANGQARSATPARMTRGHLLPIPLRPDPAAVREDEVRSFTRAVLALTSTRTTAESTRPNTLAGRGRTTATFHAPEGRRARDGSMIVSGCQRADARDPVQGVRAARTLQRRELTTRRMDGAHPSRPCAPSLRYRCESLHRSDSNRTHRAVRT